MRPVQWPTVGKIAADSAYDMFKYKYLIVNLVIPTCCKFFLYQNNTFVSILISKEKKKASVI